MRVINSTINDNRTFLQFKIFFEQMLGEPVLLEKKIMIT